MISHVCGVVDSIDGNRVVVDVNGVGYAVDVPNSLLSKAPRVGERIKLFTYQVVREDSISLCGFLTKEERSLFSAMLTVSGVGPKGAMSIISSVPVEKLVTAIAMGDTEMISRVKGVGSKTAQKVVIDLKEKVAKAYSIEPSRLTSSGLADDRSVIDAAAALMTLGYSAAEAREAIGSSGIDLSKGPAVEEIIKAALSSLA